MDTLHQAFSLFQSDPKFKERVLSNFFKKELDKAQASNFALFPRKLLQELEDQIGHSFQVCGKIPYEKNFGVPGEINLALYLLEGSARFPKGPMFEALLSQNIYDLESLLKEWSSADWGEEVGGIEDKEVFKGGSENKKKHIEDVKGVLKKMKSLKTSVLNQKFERPWDSDGIAECDSWLSGEVRKFFSIIDRYFRFDSPDDEVGSKYIAWSLKEFSHTFWPSKEFDIILSRIRISLKGSDPKAMSLLKELNERYP